MYIKSITFQDHHLFGDSIFNFCDTNGKPYETIIFAGENGTGKSTLFNIIYDFMDHLLPRKKSEEKITFILQIEESEITEFLKNTNFNSSVQGYAIKNELTVNIDYSIINNWSAVTSTISRAEGEPLKFDSSLLLNADDIKDVFKSIYSDVDVNYNAGSIQSTTSLDVDRSGFNKVKSNANIGTEIAQLLVDIEALDSSDFRDWATQNPNSKVSDGVTDNRMRRFKTAFESIFTNKKYKRVENTEIGKQVFFEEFGRQISINDLSSGEKQIVFRGSFLLRNKESTKGAIVLIDEPEISLHPRWQLKILDFYKNLFKETGVQTSQLFIATHSPFIIHNETRTNDKVIILKKDEVGKTIVSDHSEFFNWNEEQIIKDAFNIEILQNKIEETPKHLVITEGKTDWKHLEKAYQKINEDQLTDERFQFLQYEDDIEMGSSHLLTLCKSLSKVNNNYKVIAIFDRDEANIVKQASDSNGTDYKSWGNNVYSFVLPVPPHRLETPDIAIEHYYTDDEIKLEDTDKRRLYMGNEFSSKSGISLHKDKICLLKNKCVNESIQIIDSSVFVISNEDENIALSKNKFANNIYNDIEPFDKVNHENFIPVFEIINKIIEAN
ncbi:AAA family ATPase [Viridibacillus arvi]|uniref:AAA family ATPase n=1 Tax=Viridibacillus arvi TaxID=263475 RepID=UPI003676EB87